MGIYRFQDNSTIKEIDVVGGRSKAWAVHLFANETADPKTLSAIQAALTKQGLQTTAVSIDGKSALQVTGPRQGINLFGILRSNEWVNGRAEYLPSKEEKKEQSKSRWRKMLDHIGENSLRYSGFFYFVGAMNILISGLRRGNAKEAMSGLLYSVGDPVMMIYGQLSPRQQLSRVTERLIGHLHAQGIPLPEDSALRHTERKIKKGPLHQINNFLASHPAEIELAFNAAGAIQYFRSNTQTLGTPIEVLKHEETTKKALEVAGEKYDPIVHAYRGDTFTAPPMKNFMRGMKQLFTDPTEARKSFTLIKKQLHVEKLADGTKPTNAFNAALWGMLTGFGNSASAIASAVIPEKSHGEPAHADEEKTGKKKKSGGLWAWIREKPLRIAGYIYAVISLGYIKEGMNMMHDPNRSGNAHINKFATGINYIAADLLLAISPKNAENRGSAGLAGARNLAAQVAEVVAAQPEEEQHDMAQRISGFLATQPEIKRTQKEMAALIEEQLQSRKAHPWLADKMAAAVANDNAAVSTTAPARQQTPVANRILKGGPNDKLASRFPSSAGHRSRVEEKRMPENEPGTSAGPAIS